MNDIKRFWEKVEKTDDCWNWKAYVKPNGYGTFGIGGRKNHKTVYAHRYSFELLKGPIKEGLEIDHLCKNRKCVNPKHLEQVTSRENLSRSNCLTSIQAKMISCIHGHLFDEKNTRSYLDKKGSLHRVCRKCSAKRAKVNRKSGYYKVWGAKNKDKLALYARRWRAKKKFGDYLY